MTEFVRLIFKVSTRFSGKHIFVGGLDFVNFVFWKVVRFVSPIAETKIFGANFRFYTDGSFFPHYEQETTNLLLALVKSGMVVVDAGAHVGYYTVLMSKLVGPNGRVFSFEPDPRNWLLLRTNVLQNQLNNVTLVNAALSNYSGIGTFYQTMSSASGTLKQSDEIGNLAGFEVLRSISVRVTTLDEILGDTPVNIVKMDIEGGEIEALSGMRSILSKSTNLILVLEFNPEALSRAGHSPTSFFETLWRANFATWIITSTGLERIKAGSVLPRRICNVLSVRNSSTL